VNGLLAHPDMEDSERRMLWSHMRSLRTRPMQRDTEFAGIARKPLLLGFVGGGVMGLVVGAGDTLGKINELRKTMTMGEIAALTGKTALKTGAVCTGYVFASPLLPPSHTQLHRAFTPFMHRMTSHRVPNAPRMPLPRASSPCRFFGVYHVIASQLGERDIFEPTSYEAGGVAAVLALTPFALRASWRQHIPLCLLMVGMDMFDRYRTRERLAKRAM